MKSKKLYELNDDKHVRVQLPTSADNVTLLAVAAAAPAVQQSTDISCLPPGAQQQTGRTLLQRSIDGTDRRTDGHCTVTQRASEEARPLPMAQAKSTLVSIDGTDGQTDRQTDGHCNVTQRASEEAHLLRYA